MSRENTCFNCVYREDTACRRWPPVGQAIPVPRQAIQGMVMDLQNISVWPAVRPEDWCGEHQAVVLVSH